MIVSQSVLNVFLHDRPLGIEREDFEGGSKGVYKDRKEKQRSSLEETSRVRFCCD